MNFGSRNFLVKTAKSAIKSAYIALYSHGSNRFLTKQYAEKMKIRYDICSTVGWAIHRKGSFEPITNGFLKKNIASGMTCIDVGANIGAFTLIMAELVTELGTVISFEPQSAMYEMLLFNVDLNNLKNVECMNMALSDKEGQQTLYIPALKKNQGLINYGGATLDVNSSPYGVDQGNREELFQKEIIIAQKLDEVLTSKDILRVDFLKVDVEGHEYEVLRGATKTIEKWKPLLLLEFCPDKENGLLPRHYDLIELLRRFGYKFYLIDQS